MFTGIMIFLAMLIVIILWAIFTFNSFTKLQVQITEAWSEIDICLKRKANILQNMVDTLHLQTDFEGDVLVKIAMARAGVLKGDPSARMRANTRLGRLLPSLYAVMEQYPQLGANVSFTQLLHEIADCEDKILYVRKRYNFMVAAYCFKRKAFPSRLIAERMSLEEFEMANLPENERLEADGLRISKVR